MDNPETMATLVRFGLWVFNVIFNNISAILQWSVLLAEDTDFDIYYIY